MSDKYEDQMGLFPNENRATDRHPQFRGSMTLSYKTLQELVAKAKAGGEAKLSCAAWVHPYKDSKRISVSVQPWQDEPPKEKKQQVNPFAESGASSQQAAFNDDIGF